MFIMSSVWLRIVAAVVAIVVIFVIINKVSNKASKPVDDRTISDTFRDDDKRLRAEPNVVEPNASVQQTTAAQPPKFKEMTEDEKAGADQLFELAMAQRKMGRMPGVSYGAMVQYCRQILEKYPDTEYAYKAKRMLADIPASQRDRYHITDDEINPNK
jgi:hypothetical protein